MPVGSSNSRKDSNTERLRIKKGFEDGFGGPKIEKTIKVECNNCGRYNRVPEGTKAYKCAKCGEKAKVSKNLIVEKSFNDKVKDKIAENQAVKDHSEKLKFAKLAKERRARGLRLFEPLNASGRTYSEQCRHTPALTGELFSRIIISSKTLQKDPQLHFHYFRLEELHEDDPGQIQPNMIPMKSRGPRGLDTP